MLFFVFIGIEAFLLYRFIVVPLLYLFRVRKGIDNRAASKLVGKHFPEVDDRLLNLLELSESDQKSDLLLASIEQRAKTLGPVPFTEAVQVKESYRYAKYLLIPALIIGFIWITGDLVSFFNSHNRVVHYQMAFERPAPFSFKVLNESLDVLDNEPLTLRVTTTGEVRPERVSLVYNGETLVIPGFESVAQKEKLAITTKNLSLDTVQRNHIISVLEKCDWKISGPNSASELLELKPSTLRDKMSKLGIKK